jgi:hypothetical protein
MKYKPRPKGQKNKYTPRYSTRGKMPKNLSQLHKFHRENNEWKDKLADSIKGKNHWNWKGGKSRDKHMGPEYKQWRSDVFERDNWTCQTCGIRGTNLEAHHIKSWAKFPELRYELSNGVTLCKECHKLTENFKGKKYDI